MINFNTLQNSLDNSFSQANADLDDAAMAAAESGTMEDIEAFTDATKSVATANIVMNQASRAHHEITKAIIDGIQ